MNKTKKVTVVGIVLKTLSLYMLAINLIGICIISIFTQQKMEATEENYIKEIVSNISSSAEMKINEYVTAAEVIACSSDNVSFLEQTSKSSPMEKSSLTPQIVSGLSQIKSKFGVTVEYVGIVSADEQMFVTDTGDFSSPADNITSQPYYEAITSNKTVVTEPYFDTYSNQTLVSVAAPIISTKNGVVGCVVVDLSTSFLLELISDFGSTGSTWAIDNSNNILAHSNASLVGQSYTASGVSGAEFTRELANPTGEVITYDRNGSTRVGSVGYIANLGWKLVAGIDHSEYYEDVVSVVIVIITIQILIVLLALLVSGKAIALRLRPLTELNNCMDEMSKGNLSALPTYHSETEIGQLCENLRTTMTNLGIYIDEINDNLESFGNGDFTRESELVFLGDFREIQVSTEKFVGLITTTLDELKTNIDQVSSSSDFVSSGSQNLASGSIQQAESVGILNQTIEEISNSVNENVKNVEYVNERSKKASSELTMSHEKMIQMVKAMQDIQESSNAIQNIIKVIEDVAFQTDILALNAAVEASRAGQAGKGFAVVADEVRSLSSRTSEAVDETVRLIEESISAVTIGSQLVDETSEYLNNAIEVVNGYMETLDTVTETSKGQSVAILEINSGVNEITTVTQNNSAISEESAAASEELSSQAVIMKESIERFKLN